MPGFGLTELTIYALASLAAAIMSGITGGGGGFVNVPFLIFFGLSPAQAVATGKLSGLSISLASLGSLHSVHKRSKKQLAAIMALALLLGLIAPLFITRLGSVLYRRLLGILLLVMIPVVIFKKVGHTEQKPSPTKTALGYLLLIGSMSLQAIFGGGMGTLVNVVLMASLGMSALEANVTKRYSQVILNGVIVLGVLFSGLLIWPIAIVGMATTAVGGYIGGKMALKKGNRFVMSVFVILMFVSALGLLFG